MRVELALRGRWLRARAQVICAAHALSGWCKPGCRICCEPPRSTSGGLPPGSQQYPAPGHGPRRLRRSLPKSHGLERGFASDILSRDKLLPQSGFWLFFRLSGTRRSRSSVTCPYLISVPRCTPMWLHHTRIEARSPVRASAEKAMHGPLRPRNNIVPSARPLQKHG